jgi:hypothetical protein
MNRLGLLRAALVAALLTACGSALPSVVEALPAEVDGFPLEDRSFVGDGRLAAAMADHGLAADAIAGHEARWGDDIRLVILRFDAVGLNEASRVARSLLGIGDVESTTAVIGNQTAFELTGPDVEGVAYQFALSGEGDEIVMHTIVAPTVEEAEIIVGAINEARPPQD